VVGQDLQQSKSATGRKDKSFALLPAGWLEARSTLMMRTDLERAEQRMQRKWFDLAMAEERRQPVHVLERMYQAYLVAMDEYERCLAQNRQQRAS
jgi:hypothetical protein